MSADVITLRRAMDAASTAADRFKAAHEALKAAKAARSPDVFHRHREAIEAGKAFMAAAEAVKPPGLS